jgi:hypothetical protein
MKAVIKTAVVLALSIIGISTAKAQIYQFSAVDPQFIVNVGSDAVTGQLTMPNCAFTDTVTINEGNGTIEDAGSVSIPSTSLTLTYQQSQTLKAVFPNPPQTIIGDATVSFSLTGGVFAFDTGVQPLIYEGGSLWGFSGNTSLQIPTEISYSLTTGGQTYSGSLASYVNAVFHPGSTIDVTGYPGSIELIPDNGPLISNQGPAGVPAVQLIAANGFQFTAGVAPDPSSVSLMALGALGFVFTTRRRLGRNASKRI